MFGARAQSSFEMAFLMGMVILITGIVFANYMQVSDPTLALAVAKQSITEKLLKQPKPFTIESIENLACKKTLYLKVSTIPSTLTSKQFADGPYNDVNNIVLVQGDVNSNSGYDLIDLKVNEDQTTVCP
ncbi:MAG: hypothetical protein HYW50_02300 [Candidatus Diapherotrites archaeon]|nr:hypothetical protein [Candidatus Diapherotrites archaeon]